MEVSPVQKTYRIQNVQLTYILYRLSEELEIDVMRTMYISFDHLVSNPVYDQQGTARGGTDKIFN